MPDSDKPNFFISYNKADRSWAEWIAWELEEAGYVTVLQAWDFRPGQNFVLEMQRSTAEAERTLAVLSPDYMSSLFTQPEWAAAFAADPTGQSGKLVPVRVRECVLEGLLAAIVHIDLVGFTEREAGERLHTGILKERAKPQTRPSFPGPARNRRRPIFPGDSMPEVLRKASYRSMAPPQEPFVQRNEYEKVRDALLADGSARGTTVGITTAIHGAGGFGKTALAIELCYDERVRAQYPDGILWTTMGEEIDVAGRLARVRDLIRWWTDEDPPAFETVSAASAHLRQELDGKRVLLVVDDVWRPEDVTPFQGLGPRAALLVTTRDSRTLPADSVPIHVDAMEVPEAVRLLGAGLPAGAEAELKTLAALLGEWPLLLKIVNRQVASWISKRLDLREAIHRAESTLKARGLTSFDPKDAKERSQASALTLEVSLERLSPEEQKRFAELAIFPEDTNVPLAGLEKLWQLDPLDVEELASRLFDLSLLRNFDFRSGTIRLHDVIRAYLLKKGESHLPEWHQRLLDACRPASGRWPDLPREEGYLWSHLVHHLIGAGQSDVCRALLLDFHYLRSKLGATDVNALLADYSSFVARDEELRLVRDALRLSARALERHPSQLLGQLRGRLLDRQETEIQDLLEQVLGRGISWLRPRTVSLTKPGGPLIRNIEHPGVPNALAVLPDGRVVSGSSDGALRVWDVESGRTLQTLEGHADWIHAVAVLDSRRVVSGSSDGTLRVWDVESGQTLQTIEGHYSGGRALAVLDSQREVVFASSDHTLRVWDVEKCETLQTFEGHSDRIRVVAVLDSRRIVSASDDGTLRVWSLESGQTLQALEGHSDGISAMAVLDSRRVVYGYYGSLRVWDVESGQILQTLEKHSDYVSGVAVLDGRRVVSGSLDGTLRVWDAESLQALQILERCSAWVFAVAVFDSWRVVSASSDEKLWVWDVKSDQARQPLEMRSDHRITRVSTLAVLASRKVVSGSEDGMLRVWDVESGQVLQTLEEHFSGGRALAALDGRRVVFASYDWISMVWDVESGQFLQSLQRKHSSGPHALAVLDGGWVVFAFHNEPLRVWDMERGQTFQLEWQFGGVTTVAWLDRRRVISGSRKGTLHVWDVESGQILQTLGGHSDEVSTLAVLDSRRVVSASRDKTLRVWDMESVRALQTLEGHTSQVSDVAVLDSRRVISGSYDQTLRVWDVESGEVECLFTLDARVTAVAVMPDRRTIVAGDSLGRVHFFDFVEPPPPG